MARVKTGTIRKARHNKILKLNKGYRLSKSKLYKVAHEAMLHAGHYAYVGRKNKKRNQRRLWIVRLKAALNIQEKPVSYSRFINIMKIKNINLNRKVLSELAVKSPKAFTSFFNFTTSK
jgi:large subunit ribosomal protein L20